MARQSAESLYEAKTGISWLEAVNQSARLQLKAVDAHANYVGAYGTAGSGEMKQLEKEMKAKFEASMVHWCRMWQELKDV
jgi:hypothetical protein